MPSHSCLLSELGAGDSPKGTPSSSMHVEIGASVGLTSVPRPDAAALDGHTLFPLGFRVDKWGFYICKDSGYSWSPTWTGHVGRHIYAP